MNVEDALRDLEARIQYSEEQEMAARDIEDFRRRFPDVKLEEIPPEVFHRRSAGGVSLAEAYLLYGKPEGGGTALSLEERRFARIYGMSPDDYLQYKTKAEKARRS